MSRIARTLLTLPQDRFAQVIADEERVREPLPVIQRVAFISLGGGTGCTTAARRTAAVIARRRTRGVFLVDASPRSLAIADEDDRHDGGVRARSIPAPTWPGGVQHWRDATGELPREHDMTITDWGAVPAAHVRAVAEHSHVVCLSTAAERYAVQHALDTAGALAELGVACIIVASTVRGRASLATRRMIETLPTPSVMLPYERAMRARAGAPASEAFRFAALRLGAEIVKASTVSAPVAVAA